MSHVIRYPEPPEHLNLLSRNVIGAAIEVHRHLGPGYLESVYQHSLQIELGLRKISFERQYRIGAVYKGLEVGESHLDFLIEDELVVELKSVETVLQVHRAQVVSYLRAGGFHLGLLINFNTRLLKDGVHRIVWDPL